MTPSLRHSVWGNTVNEAVTACVFFNKLQRHTKVFPAFNVVSCLFSQEKDNIHSSAHWAYYLGTHLARNVAAGFVEQDRLMYGI